jgi:hypothetical protein
MALMRYVRCCCLRFALQIGAVRNYSRGTGTFRARQRGGRGACCAVIDL